jgi:hypothetical protein
MKNNPLLAGIFFLVVSQQGVTGMSEVAPDPAALLPDSSLGWKRTDQDHVYGRENLYDYIDGGAELYLSYGFTRLVSRTYAKPGQPEIVLDVFEMRSSSEAFGVFSHSREKEEKDFGQGSQYAGGLLLFWKNNFFISILASPETQESRDATFDLARRIDRAIPAEGPLPALLDLLPEKDLARETIRYFHHHIWLNSYYFIATDNILHIDETTDAVLARYGERGTRSLLLLVRYRDGEAAKAAYDDFVQHYLPELGEKPLMRIEDGTWTGCRLWGDLLAVVFNAPTEAAVSRLIEAVELSMREVKERGR